jgi:polynucleotide 5'-kinase involved in rRNA processing
LSLSDIAFQRFPIFGGTRVAVDGCTYAEKYPEGTVAVSDMPKEAFGPEATVFPTGFERGLLCSVIDGQNAVVGLALLQELDFRTGPVTSIASVTKLNE